MVNICLCDDNKDDLDHYSNVIIELSYRLNKGINLETFVSGEGLIFALESNPNKFDVIIIDIIMKNINGIDTSKILRKFGYTGAIIFLTESEDFALESFEVEPLNYILKGGQSYEKLERVLMRAVTDCEKNFDKKIIIHDKGAKKILNLDSIMYIESISKKLIIYNNLGEVCIINHTLNEIIVKLEQYGFVRCHKSYIVNINYIMSFNKLQCVLKSNIIIPIGRRYAKVFKTKFQEHEFENLVI